MSRRAQQNPTRATIDLVDAREGQCCARCGQYVEGGSRHHRQLRRHGDHSAANIVLLCGSGTTGCHGWVHAHPAESYALGWLVHSWHDPKDVPMPLAGTHGSEWACHDRGGNRDTMNHTEAHLRLLELALV